MSRTIVLMGVPIITEDGEANEAIFPGYLLEGTTGSTILKQTSSGNQPVRVALERDELGRGIDDSLGIGEAGSAAYAVGETVKIGAFSAGDRFLGFVASGVSVAVDELMDSAGDGTFADGATAPNSMVRALEAKTGGLGIVDVPIRVEVV